MSGSKRVLFSFDPRNYQALQNLVAGGTFTTASDAVRGAVQVAHALQSQVRQGFTEIVVRNPQTREERVLVLPAFDVLEAEEKSSLAASQKP
jgi:hypothetical protein